MGEKKLTFKVKRDGQLVDPRWVECQVENDVCPNCHIRSLVVVLGHKGILYAWCQRCQKYFMAE